MKHKKNNILSRIICGHNYIEVSRVKSTNIEDWCMFTDYGWYDDVTYFCENCGKFKKVTEKNKKHPGYECK